MGFGPQRRSEEGNEREMTTKETRETRYRFSREEQPSARIKRFKKQGRDSLTTEVFFVDEVKKRHDGKNLGRGERERTSESLWSNANGVVAVVVVGRWSEYRPLQV